MFCNGRLVAAGVYRARDTAAASVPLGCPIALQEAHFRQVRLEFEYCTETPTIWRIAAADIGCVRCPVGVLTTTTTSTNGSNASKARCKAQTMRAATSSCLSSPSSPCVRFVSALPPRSVFPATVCPSSSAVSGWSLCGLDVEPPGCLLPCGMHASLLRVVVGFCPTAASGLQCKQYTLRESVPIGHTNEKVNDRHNTIQNPA